MSKRRLSDSESEHTGGRGEKEKEEEENPPTSQRVPESISSKCQRGRTKCRTIPYGCKLVYVLITVNARNPNRIPHSTRIRQRHHISGLAADHKAHVRFWRIIHDGTKLARILAGEIDNDTPSPTSETKSVESYSSAPETPDESPTSAKVSPTQLFMVSIIYMFLHGDKAHSYPNRQLID